MNEIKDSSSTPIPPKTWIMQHALNSESTITLHLLEFKNFIFASAYNTEPVTGSLSISTPKLPNIPFMPTQELFQGQHSHLASALAEMLANSTNKTCIASINLTTLIGNEVQALHILLQKYLQEKNNTSAISSTLNPK